VATVVFKAGSEAWLCFHRLTVVHFSSALKDINYSLLTPYVFRCYSNCLKEVWAINNVGWKIRSEETTWVTWAPVWEHNIKMNVKELGCEVVDRIQLALGQCLVAGLVNTVIEPSASRNYGEFPDWLKEHQLLRKDSVPRSCCC
jgi:hypothetical protein